MPRQYEIFGVNDIDAFIADSLVDYLQDGQGVYSGYKYTLIVYKSGDYEANCTLEVAEKGIYFKTLNLNVDNKKIWTLQPQLVYNRDYCDWVSCICDINGVEELAPVCIINPDLLPKIEVGETIQAKVIAFSVGLKTFATEEEMEESFPIMQGISSTPELNGKRIGIEQGLIFPIGFLSNHQVRDDDDGELRGEYNYKDDIGTICGKIIGLRALDKGDANISCRIITVDSAYGELDICVADDEKDFSVGRYVCGDIVLSADVRVGDYENGAIFDEEHLLKLLCEAVESRDFSRFENVLAEDCQLLQKGAKNIVEKKKVVRYLNKLVKTNSMFSQEIEFEINNACLTFISPQNDTRVASFKIAMTDKKINTITLELGA